MRLNKMIKARNFVLGMILGMLLLTTGCGAVGMIAGGSMQTFQGRDSLLLKTPRTDILDVIAEVGKSCGYNVAALDVEQKTITLSTGQSMAATGLIGSSRSTTLIIISNEACNKLDIRIMTLGNFGAGSQDHATELIKDFKDKLLSRLEH